MNSSKQLLTYLLRTVLLFVFSLNSVVAQVNTKRTEPKNQWKAPFIKVKKNAPNILGFVLTSKNGIPLVH